MVKIGSDSPTAGFQQPIFPCMLTALLTKQQAIRQSMKSPKFSGYKPGYATVAAGVLILAQSCGAGQTC
jgi:hypothetical protein